jgi:hypothetical protein
LPLDGISARSPLDGISACLPLDGIGPNHRGKARMVVARHFGAG